MSSALVPSSGSFQQQGQVDWVALSNSTVSFSVAALARLAKAGVDPLTIQVGKALCWQFKLGPSVQHGLDDMIRSLKKYGALGDALWFGFGIKQTMTDLSETEEGLSLVALCSTLLTYFDISYSAQVLRELCLQSFMPRTFTPSQSQFRALLKLCSGIMIGSHFENVLYGFVRLISGTPSIARRRVSEPPSVANLLLELSKVQRNATASLKVTGGADCSWLAAFAECILSLDVAIFRGDAEILHRSQKRRHTLPQAIFTTHSRDGLAIHEKTALVPMNVKLIQTEGNDRMASHVAVRSTWSTILHDAFGADIDVWLTGRYYKYFPVLLGSLHESSEKERLLNLPHTWNFPLTWAFSVVKGEALLRLACSVFPEVAQSSKRWETPTTAEIKEESKQLWFSLNDNLHDACCAANQPSCNSCNAVFSLVALFMFIGILFVCELDTDITPSPLGLCYVRQNVKSGGLIYRHHTADIASIHATFTGKYPDGHDKRLALSGSGLCIYMKAMEGGSDDIDSMIRFRIVRGYVAYESQHYTSIKDLRCDAARNFWQFEKVQLPCEYSELKIEALINEPVEGSQLQLGYAVHSSIIHGNDQWTPVLLGDQVLENLLNCSNTSGNQENDLHHCHTPSTDGQMVLGPTQKGGWRAVFPVGQSQQAQQKIEANGIRTGMYFYAEGEYPQHGVSTINLIHIYVANIWTICAVELSRATTLSPKLRSKPLKGTFTHCINCFLTKLIVTIITLNTSDEEVNSTKGYQKTDITSPRVAHIYGLGMNPLTIPWYIEPERRICI